MQRYVTFTSASVAGKIRLCVYYVQRLVTSRRVRRAAHWILLLGLRMRYRNKLMGFVGQSALAPPLRTHGHVSLDGLATGSECAQMRAYLAPMPMQDSRGSGSSFTLDTVPEACRLGDYPLETVVNCPFVMRIANHPDLLVLAAEYLGFTPTITGLGLRWTFPGGRGADDVQRFHRDCEVGTFKVLMYLTDVDDGCGPHTFVPASHLERMPVRLRIHSDDDIMRTHGGGLTMLGPAGTAFAIDTKGLHKGAMPSTHPRLLLVIQYSLLPCLVFDYAPVDYTGQAVLHPYVNRLMVA